MYIYIKLYAVCSVLGKFYSAFPSDDMILTLRTLDNPEPQRPNSGPTHTSLLSPATEILAGRAWLNQNRNLSFWMFVYFKSCRYLVTTIDSINSMNYIWPSQLPATAILRR